MTNLIIIGDTHFGIRNNSMTWLRHQVDGFEEILRYIEKSMLHYDETVVVHMGDLFDSRSSINPMVYKKVDRLLYKLNSILDHPKISGHEGHAYFIGGNHDYYYPWESEQNTTSINMLPRYDHIQYITGSNGLDWWSTRGLVFIPWFSFHNPRTLEAIMMTQPGSSILFTHTDPFHMDADLHRLIQGRTLITGHIHQPSVDIDNNLLVTGAFCPTDFTDTNSDRGFWSLELSEDRKKPLDGLVFHPIISTIYFHTIGETDLNNPDFIDDIDIRQDDYVEVQLRASAVDTYKDILRFLNDNFNTNVSYISESTGIGTEFTEILNVDTVCRKMLPDKLKSIYQKMIDAYSKKE